jgi:tRNA threonylcarbamoyladenosine modification (KEOPS) complex  Pcc1 subunit
LEQLLESDTGPCTESLRRTENVHHVAQRDFLGLHLEYGIVQNVILKWRRELMILARRHCRSEIRFSFHQDNQRARFVAEAAFYALRPDTKYLSKDNSSMSKIFLDDHMITIQVEANDIPSLRASLNSYLMLFRLCINTLSDI